MTTGRAPLIGWGAFLLGGVAVAALPPPAQIAFAGAAIGGLGLPHGASDLAIVPPGRRASFLAAYLATVAGVMLLWLVAPAAGLCLLLAMSAAHFALDDAGADEGEAVDRWAKGVVLVAGPAVLHRAALAALFAAITRAPAFAAMLAAGLQGIGVLALSVAALALGRRQRRDIRGPGADAVAIAATVILPPLIGFAVGFVLLHARGQTDARRRALGCATLADYLRAVSPVLAGAAPVLAGVAILFARQPDGAISTLFAGIAALATPHMVVTPLWRLERALPMMARRRGRVVA